MSKLPILNHNEIALKLDRLAWQMAEEHFGQDHLVMIGIKERGSRIAGLIHKKLTQIHKGQVELTEMEINKDAPLDQAPKWTNRPELEGKAVILVDDVLNSGATLAGAIHEILNYKPRSLKVAVLANRDHKAFPINADFVGISVATTVMEHISFEEKKGQMAVYLV